MLRLCYRLLCLKMLHSRKNSSHTDPRTRRYRVQATKKTFSPFTPSAFFSYVFEFISCSFTFFDFFCSRLKLPSCFRNFYYFLNFGLSLYFSVIFFVVHNLIFILWPLFFCVSCQSIRYIEYGKYNKYEYRRKDSTDEKTDTIMELQKCNTNR